MKTWGDDLSDRVFRGAEMGPPRLLPADNLKLKSSPANKKRVVVGLVDHGPGPGRGYGSLKVQESRFMALSGDQRRTRLLD